MRVASDASRSASARQVLAVLGDQPLQLLEVGCLVGVCRRRRDLADQRLGAIDVVLLVEQLRGAVAREADDQLRHAAETGTREEFRAALAGKGPKADQKLARKLAPVLGERGTLAWDLTCVPYIAGQAYLAGLVAEPAAWRACFAAARVVQRTFTGWEPFGVELLAGRQFWCGEESTAHFHVSRALVLEREGPWRIAWATPLDDES